MSGWMCEKCLALSCSAAVQIKCTHLEEYTSMRKLVNIIDHSIDYSANPGKYRLYKTAVLSDTCADHFGLPHGQCVGVDFSFNCFNAISGKDEAVFSIHTEDCDFLGYVPMSAMHNFVL